MSEFDSFDAQRLMKGAMPYVTFKVEPKEDVKASREKGQYVAKDVEFACITTPGTKDILYEQLPQWWDKKFDEVRNGRCPQVWLDKWKADYERFKQGLDVPTEGTPIRGWAVISPAQQENIIRANILTVEDLATAPEGALQMIGMGAVALRYKADAWIKQAQDKGPLTQEMAALKKERDSLKGQVETLEKKVEKLLAKARAKDEVAA